MLTRPQIILLKRAQRAANIPDPEYRELLLRYTGATTSKDPRLTDAQLDLLLSYFEAIHWRAVDAGQLQPDRSPLAVFKQRGYWAQKNARGQTSRDRFAQHKLDADIKILEQQLAHLGYGFHYCSAIKRRMPTLRHYFAALKRTLAAKERGRPVPAPSSSTDPF